jgi:hypothetical protein
MPARVVGDHAVTGALERPGAHHDVAVRRGQTVQEHDREPLPCLGYGQPDAGALDLVLGVG